MATEQNITGQTLDNKIDELIIQLQGQLLTVGAGVVKMALKMAIKAGRHQAKDKQEYDRVIREHKALQEFCKEIKLKL